MEIIKKHKKQILFHLLLNFIVGIFITFSSYFHIPINDFKGFFAYAIHFLIIQFTIFGFLYLLNINKYIFYFVFPVLFISFSLFSYSVYAHDLSVTESFIQVVLETKKDIAIDLINLPLIGFFLINVIALIFILKKRSKLTENQLKSPLLILSLLAILSFFLVEKMRFRTFKNRIPYSLAEGLYKYSQKEELKIDIIKEELHSEIKDINVVFILGESVRSDHLQLNGYGRETNPKLSLEDYIISFPNIYTPLTATASSVPQILTNNSINPDLINEKVYSVYSVLNKLKINTTWIGNQTPEVSYEKFIYENQTKILIDKFHSVLSFKKKKDGVLISHFDDVFNDTSNQFTTIHMIGSHWWYESRYPDKFRVYKPTIKSKYIPSNTSEEMINSYDNTILYLDDFLSRVISRIKASKTKTLLIFLSDHGETLGENGKWLHAQGNLESQNPAMAVWYSQEMYSSYPELIDALKENSTKRISTDFFYHSILDLYKVKNFDYNKKKSIFSLNNDY